MKNFLLTILLPPILSAPMLFLPVPNFSYTFPPFSLKTVTHESLHRLIRAECLRLNLSTLLRKTLITDRYHLTDHFQRSNCKVRYDKLTRELEV